MRLKNLVVHMVLPVRMKRVLAEMGHKRSERKSYNSSTIGGDPVTNAEVLFHLWTSQKQLMAFLVGCMHMIRH